MEMPTSATVPDFAPPPAGFCKPPEPGAVWSQVIAWPSRVWPFVLPQLFESVVPPCAQIPASKATNGYTEAMAPSRTRPPSPWWQ